MDINLSKINDAFKKAIPQHVEAQAAKVEEKQAELPVLGSRLQLPDMSKLQNIDASFVSAWPEVRDALNMGLGLVGRFWPGPAGRAKAWIATMDSVVIPILKQLGGGQ